MRVANNSWNKQKQWERQKQYQVHLDRIRSIGSQKKLRRNGEKRKRNMSELQFPTLRKNVNLEQQREVELQNQRIMKKLNEIGRRKSQFVKQTRDEKKYYTINMKSRQNSRKQRFEHIQQENDMLVERILERRKSKGLLQDLSESRSPSIRKSRHKGGSSVILPTMDSKNQLKEEERDDFSII